MTPRKTRQRTIILEILRKTRSHPSAEWVYRKVRKAIPNVSLGTVYRNLKFLLEQGEIIEIPWDGEVSRYDARTGMHDHVVCVACGRIVDVEAAVPEGLEAEVAHATGFEITGRHVGFRGRCADCRRKGAGSGKTMKGMEYSTAKGGRS